MQFLEILHIDGGNERRFMLFSISFLLSITSYPFKSNKIVRFVKKSTLRPIGLEINKRKK